MPARRLDLEEPFPLRSAVAQVKEPGTARVDGADAARLARCGVGLAHRRADLDEESVRAALEG